MEGNAALSNDEIKRIMDLYTFLWHKWTLSIGQVGGRMRGGGNFSQGKIFKKFLGGWKIFPTPFLVSFDGFLVDFDAKTQMRGGKSAQNSKW